MAKTKIGPQPIIYPMPTFLVGANVDGKPNFMAVAWSGMANGSPPVITVALYYKRHTYRGIRENMTFSVNMPSTDMVKETDYCGITSGAKVDKVKVCKFDVFYGKLKSVPLIEQCPVNMECKVMHILDVGDHALVVGRIEEMHVSDECLTNGKPDINKIKPFAYITTPHLYYQAMGEVIAKSHSIGKELKARE